VAPLAAPRAADVLVNTTTVGMDAYTSRPDALRSLRLGTDLIGDCAYVVDFAYNNGPTALVQAAGELGIPTVDGLALLVEQGALSFERWTGVAAPRAAMGAAVRSA
jgi:shikimate dehydrogenase